MGPKSDQGLKKRGRLYSRYRAPGAAARDHTLSLCTCSLCTCRRQYPGAAAGSILRSTRPAISAFPDMAVGSAYTSSFSELARRSLALAACTLALSPIRDTLIEGFSHFVTSMTAPIASDWSGCRVGLAPTGKRRLCTAHTHTGHRRPKSATGTPAGLRNFGVIPGVMN
jgi:hypothetical protein